MTVGESARRPRQLKSNHQIPDIGSGRTRMHQIATAASARAESAVAARSASSSASVSARRSRLDQAPLLVPVDAVGAAASSIRSGVRNEARRASARCWLRPRDPDATAAARGFPPRRTAARCEAQFVRKAPPGAQRRLEAARRRVHAEAELGRAAQRTTA